MNYYKSTQCGRNWACLMLAAASQPQVASQTQVTSPAASRKSSRKSHQATSHKSQVTSHIFGGPDTV